MKKLISTRMKIFMLVLFILSLGCYVLADINLYWSNYSFSSYNINDWRIGWEHNKNHSSGTIEKDFPNTTENVNIIAASSNVSIVPYEGSTIKIDINGIFASDYNYNDCIKKFDVNEKDITIQTVSDNFLNDTSLNISIPSGFKENINIQTVSGDISISSLTLSNLSLSATSGNIDCYNINSTSSKITSISGEINYAGSLGESNISSTSGNMEFKLSDLGNSTAITSTSGEINVSIASVLGYKADLSSTSGNIDTPNNDSSLSLNKSYSFINGDGSRNISINTTSGDISIS